MNEETHGTSKVRGLEREVHQSIPIQCTDGVTVRLLTTCRIPGYQGHTVKAQVGGDWSQVQGKEFLFEPDRETLQKDKLDALW